MNISTFIACYNHQPYLAKAVESLLNQTVVPREIILIDDGSTDGSFRTMMALQEKYIGWKMKIRAIRHPHQYGNIRSYNQGIEECAYHYVHLMAADDVLLNPRFYQHAGFLLDQHSDVGAVAGGLRHIDEEGKTIFRHSGMGSMPSGVDPPQALTEGIPEIRTVLEYLKAFGNFICGGAVLVRREAYAEAGPYDLWLPTAADFLMWIRILQAGWKMGFMRGEYYGYRVHPGQMTYHRTAPQAEVLKCYAELDQALEKAVA